MQDSVYKVIEVVGSSKDSIECAIQNAISQSGVTLKHLRWFKVVEVRGAINDAFVEYYQVALKIGFHVEDRSVLSEKQTILPDSPAKEQQQNFIAEGGNSQPLSNK